MLCDCATDEVPVCTARCMTQSVTAMDLPVPSCRLTTTGVLSAIRFKQQSPWTNTHGHISNIMVSAVLNIQPPLNSWAGVLLSVAVWSQVCVFSGNPKARRFDSGLGSCFLCLPAGT